GRDLLQRIDPPALGLTFANMRGPALAASTQALDFGALFLSLSFLVIVAALLLTALLFAFGIEQRGESIGVMLAMGFRPRDVRRLLLAEGMTLSIVGAIVGIGAGLLYTRAVLAVLGGVWNRAVGTSDIVFHVEPTTLIIG